MINVKLHIPKLISSSSSSSSIDLCSIIKPDDGNSCAYTNNNAKNNLLNLIMKKSFNFGLNKIADAFEQRALKLFK